VSSRAGAPQRVHPRSRGGLGERRCKSDPV
jgi:hypothetical protein